MFAGAIAVAFGAVVERDDYDVERPITFGLVSI
jgi:hypothetical protein